MSAQGLLSFEENSPSEGYSKWIECRKIAAASLAKNLALPLGHKVEVWLTGNVRLCGTLRLQEERLFMDPDHLRHLVFVVDHTPFAYRELERCTRLD